MSVVTRCVESSGWSIIFAHTALRHPFDVFLTKGDRSFGVRVYIWNISHGGKKRPVNEFRVQVTGVDRLERWNGFHTVVLGYSTTVDVFAAWDIGKHEGPIAWSASLQIRLENLNAAGTNGISVCTKDQGEIAVAVAPWYLAEYLVSAPNIHTAGAVPAEATLIDRFQPSADTFPSEAIAALPEERRVIVREVATRYRDASFRTRVVSAYGNACGMCGTQLELVDAAHIVPVFHPASTDRTTNGLCLCASHHRAFDSGLVRLRPDYSLDVDGISADRLLAANLAGGLPMFAETLRPKLRLPVERSLWPDEETLRLAATLRSTRP